MKTMKEKAFERAFLRVMNKIIACKEAFLFTDDNKSVVCLAEDIDAKLAELQQEFMSVVQNWDR